MKRVLATAAAILLAGWLPALGQPREEGWILLHDGESHFGWTQTGAAWSAARGILAAEGGAGLLRSNTPFSDFLLHFEIRAEKSAAGALYVRAAREGHPKETGYGIEFAPLASTTWTPVEVEASATGVSVRVAGRLTDHSTVPVAPAGFLFLESRGGGRIEIRNLRLRLLRPELLFNGSDLSGWKSTGEPARQKGGLGRLFGGGKPREAKWTVVRGMIHGSDGPGQLESLQQFGDFILQADVRINAKRSGERRRYAILLRGEPGRLGSGYEVNVQPGATGALMGLTTARKNIGSANEFVTVTVAAHGRHIQIWADGVPVTDFIDARPEGADPKRDARSTPGVIAFFTPEDDADIDIRNVRLVQLPKTFGQVPKKTEVTAVPATPPVSALPPAAPSAVPGAPAPGPAAIQQPLDPQHAQMKQEQRTQQEAMLLQQALRTTDPAQQIALFDQILAINPNNQVAFNGRKEAMAKLEEQQRREAEKAAALSQQEQAERQRQMTLAQSIQAAEAAFLAGNLLAAEKALNAAERIAPDNPQVQALRSRLNYVNQRRSSILAIAATGAGAGLVGLLAWFFAMRRRRDPYIEVIAGLDKGKRFNIDKEVVMVGAIPEDGGMKNDIVLRDAERMISRFHAQFRYRDGKLYIVDTNSYNGTFVDRKRIEPGRPVQVRNGSRITFAGTCTVKVGFERRKKK